MRTILTLGLLLATAVPAVAHAEESGAEPESSESTTATALPAAPIHVAPKATGTPELPPEPAPAPAPPVWYGTQTLLADAAALGLLIGAATLGSATHDDKLATGLAWAGVGTYVLGAPIVHLAHDRPHAAIGSLGLRVGAPVVAGLVGMAIEQQSCSPGTWFCGLGGLVLGGAVGVLGAVAIDTAAIAWAPRTQLMAAPMVGGGRLGVNLGGTF